MPTTPAPSRPRNACTPRYHDDGVPAPLLPWHLGWEADCDTTTRPALDGETPCAGFDPYAPLTRRVLRGTGGAR